MTDPFAVTEAVEFFLVLFLDCLRTEFLSKLCRRNWTSSIPPDDFSFSFPKASEISGVTLYVFTFTMDGYTLAW